MPVAAAHPRGTWRGVVTCARTVAMLNAQRDLLISWGHSYIADGLYLAQGSYRPATDYSARTHCGCGVVDIGGTHRVTGVAWTSAEWALIVKAGRAVGFAAWHRTPAQGKWPHHCHQIAKYCPDLDPQAVAQVAAYLIGLNGLSGASRGPDEGPRESIKTTWESYRTPAPQLPSTTQPTQEDDMLYWTDEHKTVWVASATRALALSDINDATAIALARSGGVLTDDQVRRVLAVQAQLREPAIATVTEVQADGTTGTVYAVTDRLVPLGAMTTVAALGAIHDGAKLTAAQVAAAKALG